MKINQAGLDLIKSFEGCRLKAYKDVIGVWTIGVGHTGPEVVEGLIWSPEQANEALAQDLVKFEEGVSNLLTAAPTPNQFSAMVAFAFNVGLANLKSSTLLRCFNKHNAEGAAGEFLKWDHADGRVIPGLTRRRQAESDLFKA